MAEAKVGSPSTRRLLQFLPPDHSPTNCYIPVVIVFSFARDSVTAYDSIFDRCVPFELMDSFYWKILTMMKELPRNLGFLTFLSIWG